MACYTKMDQNMGVSKIFLQGLPLNGSYNDFRSTIGSDVQPELNEPGDRDRHG
jgi:hypothetical protein